MARCSAAAPRRLLVVAAWAAVAVALFCAYLRQALAYGDDSDGAANVLQAWDMLHGNLLLHGWWLTDVSFYTTELPEFMIVEVIHGMNGAVSEIAAAVTYTLLIALAAAAAKGQATGVRGLTRVLIAGGILLAPWNATGPAQLFAPDHTGTAVPLLLIFLVIDRLGDRWYTPWLVGVLLTWVEIADQLALYVGAAPVIVFSVIRLARRRESRPAEAGLLAAAAASVPVALVVPDLIRRAGGYVVYPAPAQLTTVAAVPEHVRLAAHSVLILFGANVIGLRPGLPMAMTVLHLVGVVLVGWGFCIGLWRLPRADDRLAGLLVVSISALLAAYILSNEGATVANTREISPVFPLGAVLAGRLLADRLVTRQLLPGRRATATLASVLLAALVAYAGVLGYNANRPAAQPPFSAVVSWLTARHLTAGIGNYWAADLVTVDTSGQIRVSAVIIGYCGRFVPYAWNAKRSWYEPPNTARFLIFTIPEGGPDGTPAQAASQFGTPEQTTVIGSYQVLVWKHNVLPALTSASTPKCNPAWAR